MGIILSPTTGSLKKLGIDDRYFGEFQSFLEQQWLIRHCSLHITQYSYVFLYLTKLNDSDPFD